METTNDIRKEDKKVPVLITLILYFVILIVGMLIACPDINGWKLAPVFPFGLLVHFRNVLKGLPVFLGIIPYGIYIGLFILFITLRKKLAFSLLCLLMVALVLLNASGCRNMLESLSKIN